MRQRIYHGVLIIVSSALLMCAMIAMDRVFNHLSPDAHHTQYLPALGIDLFIDESKKLTIEDVVAQAFTPIRGQSASLGFHRDAVWLRVQLPPVQRDPMASPLWLTIQPVFIDEVQAYVPQADGTMMRFVAGDRVETPSVLPRVRVMAFPVDDATVQAGTVIYMRLSSQNVMMFDVQLSDADAVHQAEHHYAFWIAIVFGLIIFALVSGLFIGLATRDALFFYYALYVIISFVLMLAIYGWWQVVLLPGDNDLILSFGQLLVGLPLFMIVARLLRIAAHYPRIYQLVLFKVTALPLIGIPLVLLGYFQPVMQVTHILVLLFNLLLLLVCVSLFKIERLAVLVFAMFITFFWGVVLRYGVLFGWLPMNFVTENTAMLGFLLQAVLLYAALGYRFRYLQKEKDAADRRVRSVEDEVQHRRLFMGMLNHELRTPMAIIDSAACNLMSSRQCVHWEDKKRLEKIRSAIVDMRHLMQVCLGSDRLSGVSQQQESVSLQLMLEAVLAHLATRHYSERVIYEGLDTDVFLPGDADMLVLALSNVVDNALKYSAEDRAVELLVSRSALSVVRICVVDQGRGFDASLTMGRVQRGANVGDTQGLGMGLSLAQEIVMRHHGRLWIDSTDEKGSVVCIELACLSTPSA